jgi:hypothetical protein
MFVLAKVVTEAAANAEALVTKTTVAVSSDVTNDFFIEFPVVFPF